MMWEHHVGRLVSQQVLFMHFDNLNSLEAAMTVQRLLGVLRAAVPHPFTQQRK